MTAVRAALLWSLVERYLLIALALANNIILARLLTPEEIGIYSVSLALIGVAQVVREFGIGAFLVQEKQLTDDHISTAFGISLVIGVTLYLIVTLIAPALSSFYGERTMVVTLRIVAINFLVLPFCSISVALLRRDMQFKRLMYVAMGATSAGTATTLGLAWFGVGANSMAIGSIATNAFTGLGAWLARSDRSLLMPRFTSWRKIASFGVQSSLANAVNSLAMDANDLVLGKVLGFAPVAVMSRAQGLVNLFQRDIMDAVRNVAFPAFAQSARNGEDLEPKYIKATSIVCLISWPFYGFVALFPLEILRMMFGLQWDAAAPLVRWIAFGAAFGSTASLVNSVMLGAGRIDLVTKGSLIFSPLRAFVVVVAAITTESLQVVAAALAFSYALYLPIAYSLKGRCLANDYRSLMKSLVRSGSITALALSGPFAIAVLAGLDRVNPVSLGYFFLAGILLLFVWLIGVYLLDHPIKADPIFSRVAGRVFPRRRKRGEN